MIAGALVGFILVVNPVVDQLRQSDPGADASPADVVRSSISYGWHPDEDRNNRLIGESMQRASAGGYLAETMCLKDLTGAEPMWGRTYLASVATLVPRIVWPTKPKGFPDADMVAVTNVQFRIPDVDSVGNPVMEGFINFSYPGVAASLFLMGLLARLFWAYRQRHQCSAGRLGLYLMAMLAFFAFETHSTLGILGLLRLPVALIVIDGSMRAIGALRESAIGPRSADIVAARP
jgi:hypothetical protein